MSKTPRQFGGQRVRQLRIIASDRRGSFVRRETGCQLKFDSTAKNHLFQREGCLKGSCTEAPVYGRVRAAGLHRILIARKSNKYAARKISVLPLGVFGMNDIPGQHDRTAGRQFRYDLLVGHAVS